GDKNGNKERELKKLLEMSTVFDSMQLAHKCILNSFYGYVMRKSSRWYSMPMAAITTQIGAEIIKGAREFLENFSRPLELDTDGVWCCLPSLFPTDFEFCDKNGVKKRFSFLCSVLNLLTHEKFENRFYQKLVKTSETAKYETKTECSIFFEADGPYRCMMLPASPEEGKTLKKRYAVFNRNNTLAELKGFELKRRGELKIVKIYQTEVFYRFLNGQNLSQIYSSAAQISNYWLDVIFGKGKGLRDEDIFDLFAESKNMSRNIEDYEKTKSTSITCAKRIGEFLGDKMIQGEGLSLKFVISRFPEKMSVSERVIPVTIFQVDDVETKKRFLKKWCKQSSMQSFDVRDIIDWEYYKERLGVCIRKIVTLPAAIQNIENPVKRLPHPDWLKKLKFNNFNQPKIKEFFIDNLNNNQNETEFEIKNIKNRSPKINKDEMSKILKEKLEKIINRKIEQKTKILIENASFDEDFPNWLKMAKLKWSKVKTKNIKPKTMNQFVKNANLKFGKSNLKIVQILKFNNSKQYLIWASTNNNLFKFYIFAPNRFLVNFYSNRKNLVNFENSQFLFKKSKKTLPQSKKLFDLYEVTPKIDSDFKDDLKFADWLNLKVSPFVEGVYEAFVPTIFKVVTKLTNNVKFVNFEEKNSKKSAKNLDDFEALSKVEKFRSKDLAKVVFVYHSRLNARGFFAVFVRDKDLLKGLVIFVNSGDNVEIEQINVGKLVDRISRKQNFKDFGKLDSKIEKKSSKNFEEATKMTEKRILIELKEHKNFFVLFQTQISFEHLFPAIKFSAPCVSVPFNKVDCKYPAFRWVRFLVTTAVNRFKTQREWWLNQSKMANYCRIPIGNLLSGDLINILDIFYARELEKNGICSWFSRTKEPDFGGYEEDEFFVKENDSKFYSSPGLYRTYCIEFRISILSVCAILFSEEIEKTEMDQTLTRKVTKMNKSKNLLKKFRSTNFLSGETGNSSKAVKVLVKMVEHLWHDAAEEEDENADLLLGNVNRWLRCRSSLAYDPYNHNYVKLTMERYLRELVKNLRKIGSEIIFLSFEKLILDTRKTDFSAASVYENFVLKSLMATKMFSILSLTKLKIWKTFLFLDSNNFAGIEEIGYNSQKIDPKLAKNSQNSKNQNNVKNYEIESNWNICEYLPTEAEKCFQTVLSIFIFEPFEKFEKTKFQNKNEILSFCKELVNTKITRYLFDILPELQRSILNTVEEADKNFFRKQSSSAINSAYNP
ncbi:hypothetical protein MHBO_001142, partial [Bonamia ostreae]